MALTREELLAYLRQARADYPLLTKEELTALAMAHFAAESAAAKPAASPTAAEPMPEPTVITDKLIKEQPVFNDTASIIALTEELQGELADELVNEPHTDGRERVWPVLNRRAVAVTLLLAVIFSAVIAGAYFYGLRTSPPQERELVNVDILRKTIPYETGELTRFGKRFAGNSSYYDDKYQNKVLEMVGLVEVVERNSQGYLEATLLLADQRNAVYRARFRFLPEQEEAIALASGNMAVLKGNYVGYANGVMRFFPTVVVYNSAQPED